MGKPLHISDAELIAFADREMQARRTILIDAHLHECDVCRLRLANLQSAAVLYEQFHHQILKPRLAAPQVEWRPLHFEEKLGRQKAGLFSKPFIWWAVSASSCLALVALFLRQELPARQMRLLLARASEQPVRPRRTLELSVAGRSWYRPAVLTSDSGLAPFAHVKALFTKANYSWEDPLSARSFATWRSRLRGKRDHVTSLTGTDGVLRLYRLRTETADGALHTASLTLRAYDLAAVDGAFEFNDRERVTMAVTGQNGSEVARSEPPSSATQTPAPRQLREHKISAADELRMFAALDEIGADVGEPVSVESDVAQGRVIVTGMGLPAAREREIRDALLGFPNAVVRFYSAQAPSANATRRAAAATNPNAYATDVSAPFRRTLEERIGGAQQLEAVTDRALNASTTLLARAHALLVLAQRFSPDVAAAFDTGQRAVLHKLRHNHAIAIEQTTLELEASLKPLLKEQEVNPGNSAGTVNDAHASWEAEAADLFEQARALDQSVVRLLGAHLSQEAGESVLNQLPNNVENVEALARWHVHAE